jgi:hypothetical protein
MNRRAILLAVGCAYASSCAPALAETITTDKTIYDVTDPIAITFSYGNLYDEYGNRKDMHAFITTYRGNGNGGRFLSNAYDQQTGSKKIEPHHLPAGDYHVVMFYDVGDLPPQGGRIVASATFRILDCSDQTTIAEEQKRYNELYKLYSASDLAQRISREIDDLRGSASDPNLQAMPAYVADLQRSRAALSKPLADYNRHTIAYLRSWANWKRGIGLGPTPDDMTRLGHEFVPLFHQVRAYNAKLQKLKTVAESFPIVTGPLANQLSALLAKLKSDIAGFRCQTDGRLSELVDKWTRVLDDLAQAQNSIPQFDANKVPDPKPIKDLLRPLEAADRDDTEKLRKSLKGLVDCLETVDPLSFVLVRVLEACGVVKSPD